MHWLKTANLILLRRRILPILSDSRISCSRNTACRNCLRHTDLAIEIGQLIAFVADGRVGARVAGIDRGKDDVPYERI